MEIDAFNKFGVASNGDLILILIPPRGPISAADALNLAAYIVTLADPGGQKFAETLKAVQSA